MEVDIDHYTILGLPSGEEGAKLSAKEISKAYRSKALELHPDKRPDDREANANFQKLKTSYEILKNDNARKLFDDLLRIKHEKLQRQSQQDSKRRKMVSDLEQRERYAFASDSNARVKDEEESIAQRLKEEIARIRAMHSSKVAPAASVLKKETMTEGGNNGKVGAVDGLDEKGLKVSWEKVSGDYSAKKLRELFGMFGEVEDVVIRSSKKKGSALVVMASKDAAAAATGIACGDLSNPLLVLPLRKTATTAFQTAKETAEADGPKHSNLVGPRYQAYEDSILKKLQEAAQKQKKL